MKRLLTMLLCLVLAASCAFGVAACTPDDAKDDTGIVTPGEDEEQPGGDEEPEPELPASEGLSFALNDDGASYAVTGIGTCTDTNVVIPSEYNGLPVTSIGDGAFSDCWRLANITIPNSVTSIGDSALSNCTSLTNITIPNSVTSIGDSALYWCSSLTSVTVDPNNSVYHSSGNCLIETDSKTLIAGCSTSVIPADGSITSIGDGAFASCRNLTSIVIPDSVTTIGDWAFYWCSSLTSVTIGDYVTSIGDRAFSDCTSLTSVTIPNSVTSIGYAAFSDCTSLTSVTVDPNNSVYRSSGNCLIETDSKTLIAGCSTSVIPADGSVTSIGDGAFSYCGSLTSITIPDSVTSIGSSAFCWCSRLTSVTIGDSVTTIGERAFDGCTNLANITIGGSVASIDGSLFYDTAYYGDESNWENGVLYIGKHLIEAKDSISGEYIIKAGTKVIADNAFRDRYNLTSITIPDSVTTIGSSAFSGCGSLTSIIIPDSVTSIGDGAFHGCTGLANITIPDSVTTIGDWAFAECDSLTSIVIPDSVTSIGSRAFSNCINLANVTIGDSVTTIGDSAFSYCTSLTSITVDPDNSVYHSSGNCLIETDSRTLIAGCSKSVIPADGSVTSIGDYAFDGCLNLTSIIIPDSVTTIGDSAFSNCINLANVTIGDSVTSIGDYAFSGCLDLTSIIIPDSVTSIGDFAFSSCYDLTTVCYTGSEEEWEQIEIGNWNDELLDAEIIFNCTGE